MFNGHYDTVTLSGYDGDPLDPRRIDTRLHGRGSYDMKSGLAAAMVATARAVTSHLRGDVIVCCVADEEHSSWGTMEVLEKFGADAAVVTEPTDEVVKVVHKGFVWFDVTIVGRAAHGSLPSEGIDAISKAGHFLVEVEKWGNELAKRARAQISWYGDSARVDHPWWRRGVELSGGMSDHHRETDGAR